MAIYYNRYHKMTGPGGKPKPVPFIKLRKKSSDKHITYKHGVTRFDRLSQKYYGNPFHGWLIMLANPSYGGQEWNIPDDTLIIVPFPLMESLEEYKTKLDKHFLYYGK